MNVLSLFDGKSSGYTAMELAGLPITHYYSSEVDKYAIQVSDAIHPNQTRLGDVTKWLEWDIDWSSIDLVLAGSPCQGFSFAGKQLAFDDPRSKLFFVFVDILSHIKSVNPQVKFLLENVKMKKEFIEVINEQVGEEPILINSALLSAQNRNRYYWTSFEVTQPEDKGVVLSDILEDVTHASPAAIRGRYLNKATIVGRRINDKGVRDDYNKSVKITQCLEVRASNRDKSNCLTTVDKDNVLTNLPIGRHVDAYGRNLPYRYYTSREKLRLQTVPDHYIDKILDCGLSDSQLTKIAGNGWTDEVIAHILRGLKPNSSEIPNS